MVDTGRAAGLASGAINALSAVSQAVSGSSRRVGLGSLIDLGPYDALPLGQKPQAGVTASAFDLLSGTAQIANGQNQISANLALRIPGVTGARLDLAVGERPAGVSAIAIGRRGASAHTAQTRLLLTVQLGGSGAVASVTLPLYVEVAAATATLDAVACGFPDVATSTVTLGVKPGIVDAWIGSVSRADFINFRSAPNPDPAALATLPLVQISGRAHATIANAAPQPVTFSYGEILSQTRKTVTTTQFTSTLLAKLLGDLKLDVKIAGVDLGLSGTLTQAVTAIIGNVATPLDQVLANLLATLGAGVGQADVQVSGIRCDGAVLVN